MGYLEVNLSSFDDSSIYGATIYGTTDSFTIPANSGITSVSISFTTHRNTGSFADKAIALNGSRAIPSNEWLSSGKSLSAGLLQTGSNTARISIKATSHGLCSWKIGTVKLHIYYNDPGGGGSSPGYDGGGGGSSLSKAMMDFGETVNFKVPGSSDYWHVLRIQFLNYDVSQVIGTGYTHQWLYTPSLAMMSQIPNKTSATLTATCRVYSKWDNNGDNVLKTETRTMTVMVPYWVKPTIGSWTASRIDNGLDETIDEHVQGKTGATLTAAGIAGAYGSTISRRRITGNGYNVTGVSSLTVPVHYTAGIIPYTITVTDSRGRTTSEVLTIDVLAYILPRFSNAEAYRCTDAGERHQKGTYARLLASMIITTLNGKNSATMKGRVYQKGGTPGAWTNMTPGAGWITGGGDLSVDRSYIAEIMVTDKITSNTVTLIIPTKRTAISILPGAKGVAFGKVAEIEGMVDIEFPRVSRNGAGIFPAANILHNWDFRQPVNQREASGTISSGTYFFDRWIRQSGSVTVEAGYLTLASGATIEQRIEGHGLVGETVTASVRVGNDVFSGSETFPASGTKTITLDGFGTALFGYNASYLYARFTASGAKNLVSVKLEMGEHSTLHLDPPMDHAVELPKCQRYMLNLGVFPLAYGYANTATHGRLYLPTPVSMRINPTFNISTTTTLGVDGSKNSTLTSVLEIGRGGVTILFDGSGYTANRNIVGNLGGGANFMLFADL